MSTMTMPLLEVEPLDALRARAAVHPASYWVQAVSHLQPKYGGISSAVPALAAALEDAGVRAGVAAFCHSAEQHRPAALPADRLSFWPHSRRAWLRLPGLGLSGLGTTSAQRDFERSIAAADGVHIHGLWEQSSLTARRAAQSLRKPYVVSPHGMLDSWALRQKQAKKRVYSALAERGTVRHASCLHALTRAEAADCFNYAGRRSVAVIPNGVTAPGSLSPQAFFDSYPELQGKRIFLFLGRLHAKKGVLELAEAWKKIAAFHPEAHLVFAGPDSGGVRARLEPLAGANGVLFTGMLDERAKWSALAAAECFVLPSHSEGLSMGVLEAMAAGTPVLLTAHCNLPEVESARAGWTVEPQADTLAEAMRFVLGNPQAANAATGARGRDLARRVYSWPVVAAQMAEVYRWLQGDPYPTLCEVLR